MNLLLNVLDPFNKFGFSICLSLIMGGLLCEDEMSRSTSMGANGWNPKHTLKGFWRIELWRALL
jgi:hypothetical protein